MNLFNTHIYNKVLLFWCFILRCHFLLYSFFKWVLDGIDWWAVRSDAPMVGGYVGCEFGLGEAGKRGKEMLSLY
jgi:hypothetical protein